MALMEWKDELSVGSEEIDEQHRNLVELLNRLHEAVNEGKSKEALSDLLSELIESAEAHFQKEEAYMQDFDYSGYSEHKRDHDNFVEEVTDFQAKFETGEILFSVEVMEFLRDWFAAHIKSRDGEYEQCFRDHQLS